MEQVQLMLKDGTIHLAAPIVLAGLVGDKVALSDEVVILNREITAKVRPNVLDDLFPPSEKYQCTGAGSLLACSVSINLNGPL